MGNLSTLRKQVWTTRQFIADFNPPVLNTIHEVFNEVGGVRLINTIVYQTNTPAGGEDVDILLTRNGVLHLYDASAIGGLADSLEYSATIYCINPAVYPAFELDISLNPWPVLVIEGATAPYDGYYIEAETMSLAVRQTSAIAAGARIRVKATYEVLGFV